jgi:RNA polymerase sigma-70 factor (ECF subfamily)
VRCDAEIGLKVDFEAEYRNCYGRVFGLCLRLLGRTVHAEDATQEAFERAYRALRRYDATQPFAAWVLGIARHHCIDLLRRRGGALRFGDEAAEVAAAESERADGVDALVDAERTDAVRAAIAALPEKYRVPIVLAYYEQSSYDEIAAALGLTRNHVGVLLLRGRQALRRALESAGLESPGATQEPPP